MVPFAGGVLGVLIAGIFNLPNTWLGKDPPPTTTLPAPAIFLHPNHTNAGQKQTVTVQGRGFIGDKAVRVTLGERSMDGAVSGGEFMIRLRVPQLKPGGYKVIATGSQTRRWTVAEFDVWPRPPEP